MQKEMTWSQDTMLKVLLAAYCAHSGQKNRDARGRGTRARERLIGRERLEDSETPLLAGLTFVPERSTIT